MPTLPQAVGKAAQFFGVVDDRFDGLAQGMKRAQAESGTATVRVSTLVRYTSQGYT